MSDQIIVGVFAIAGLSLTWAGWAVWRDLSLAEEDAAYATLLDHMRRGGMPSSLAPDLLKKAERARRRRER